MALAGITNRKKKQYSGARTNAPKSAAAIMKKVFTKACTTDLVGEVMESYFRHQLAAMSEKQPKEDGDKKKKKKKDEEEGSEDGEEGGDGGSDSSEKENKRKKQSTTSQRRQGGNSIEIRLD